MPKRDCFALLTFILCILFGTAQFKTTFAENSKLTSAEVVSRHLQSLGKPELLKKYQSRTFHGMSSFHFIQGMSGSSSTGQLIFAAEGNKLGIVLKYDDLVYPGEYFAYNGEDVTVGYISPGQRSPLADFIFRYNRLMKEGLLGGVWSISWPLLDIQKSQLFQNYRATTMNGRRLHELEYRPQKNLGDLKVKLYFDFDTFRHVRTEYRVQINDDNSTRLEPGDRRRGTGISRFPGGSSGKEIFDTAPDSIYLLVEKFDEFHDYSGLMFPSVCNLDYSVEGQGNSIVAQWTMKADAIMVHNGKVRDDFFVAKK
jgi:hypothetical protein